MAKHIFHHLVFAGPRPDHPWEGSEPPAMGAQSSAGVSCRTTSAHRENTQHCPKTEPRALSSCIPKTSTCSEKCKLSDVGMLEVILRAKSDSRDPKDCRNMSLPFPTRSRGRQPPSHCLLPSGTPCKRNLFPLTAAPVNCKPFTAW